MPKAHRLFPIGLNCTHCGDWRDLGDAVAHIDQLHQDCLSCSAERLLAKAMLEDFEVSIAAYRPKAYTGAPA